MEIKEQPYFELKQTWLIIQTHTIQEGIEYSNFFDGLLDYDHPKIYFYTSDGTQAEIELNHSAYGYAGIKFYRGKKYTCFLSRVKNKRARWKIKVVFENANKQRQVV